MDSVAVSRVRPRPSPILLLICLGLMLPAGSARAQSTGSTCEPPAAVKSALDSLPEEDATLTSGERRTRKLDGLRRLLQQFPNDAYLHMMFQDVALGGPTEERRAVVEYYRALSAGRPADPLFLYLQARPLIGRKTAEARAMLEGALGRDPNFVWAHLSLAEIYNLPQFRDKEKAKEAVKSLFRLCPVPLNAGAYRYLRSYGDAVLVREVTQALRARLESSRDPHELAFHSTLWQLEFAARPVAEHSQMRERVKADLERLRGMNLIDNRRWLETLRSGYRITDDKAGRRWAEDEVMTRFRHSLSAKSLVLERWQEENPQPDWAGPVESLQAYYAKLLPVTQNWIRRWPNDASLRYRRFYALAAMDGAHLAETQAAFDALQKAMENGPGTLFAIPPAGVRMAQLYLKHGVHLDRVPDLVGRGFKEFEAVAEEERDSDTRAGDDQKDYAQINLESVYWSGWPVLAEAYLRTNQLARAREIVLRMGAQLAKEKPGEKAEASDKSVYLWRESWYLEWAGRVAEAEGRRLDALTLYHGALTARPAGAGSQSKQESEGLSIRARRLWLALSGTEEGWLRWLGRGAPKAIAATGGVWEERERQFPDFDLTDFRGRAWRLAELKGKTLFINVWATWCRPCQQELPYVQKLHERFKDRQDVVVLTFNIDQEVGLVEPYAKEKRLTLPVLSAGPYVEGLYPQITIPRSWVVGPDGTLRAEQSGFGGEGQDWFRRVLDLIEKVGAGR